MEEKKDKEYLFIDDLSSPTSFMIVNLVAAYLTIIDKPELTTLKDCFNLLFDWAKYFFGIYILLILIFVIVYGLLYSFDISQKAKSILVFCLVPILLFVVALTEVY